MGVSLRGWGLEPAQLTFGNGMIMLGDSGTNEFDALQKTPGEVGGVGTQSAYVTVLDVDTHHDCAVKAGADVVLAPADQPQGVRLYSCRDPEGHLWNFGSHDPWAPSA